MSECRFKGEVEVRIVDRKGNIEKRVIGSNFITNVGKQVAIERIVRGISPLSALFQGSHTATTPYTTNVYSTTNPSTMGLYLMSDEIDEDVDMVIPPYVQPNLTSLTSNVPFYGTSAVGETDKLLIPSASYLDPDTGDYAIDFVKNYGVATIKSISVGRIHGEKNSNFGLWMHEQMRNPTWVGWNLTAPYLLEHRTTGSFLWKYYSGYMFQVDLSNMATPVARSISGTACGIPGVSSGIAVTTGPAGEEKTIGYRAIYSSATSTTHTVNLQYTTAFYTATSVATKPIVFTLRDSVSAGATNVGSSSQPVIVYLPETNQIQVFQTLSYGNHGDDGYGCNVQVATISGIDDPANMTYEIEDLGILDYGIGNHSSSGENYSLQGYYDVENERYYLPYAYVKNHATSVVSVIDSTFTPGIIYDAEFTAPLRRIIMRISTSQSCPFILVDGKIRQIWANSSGQNIGFPYVRLSQVFSAINLPEPVTKPSDKILHVIYKYRLMDVEEST
ncbi:MAG: hypothetical protein LBP59_10995 [Planctomycetaceae bacterium]|jgi:hypothetical protein|nr:hypothetical protein [Planctomycetaceae bacterium]